jgi:hypothetical protein
MCANLVDVARVVVGILHTGALVGEGLAEELLPHVVYAGRARNAANPTKRVRSSLIANRDTHLLKRKKPTFKHFENLFDPIRRDGHSIHPKSPMCEDNSHAGPKEKPKGLHRNS